MTLPYQVATLLFCFSKNHEILLMQRHQEPNLGLWSPCGGKLHMAQGESPYACACREAREELNLEIQIADLHLTGIVSECGYQGQSHWLMFLFEIKTKLDRVPEPHREGRFAFIPPEHLQNLPLPRTDRERIWPWFWQHRHGYFAAHCRCPTPDHHDWTLEESLPAASPQRC